MGKGYLGDLKIGMNLIMYLIRCYIVINYVTKIYFKHIILFSITTITTDDAHQFHYSKL